ncbi:unnamed protein product, partial [Prunus brigantina]
VVAKDIIARRFYFRRAKKQRKWRQILARRTFDSSRMRQIAPFFCNFDFSSICAAASAENSIRSLGLDFGVISVRSSGGIMSRRWIQNPNRCADEYLDGIEDFIEFARRHNPGATRIRCPCRRCNNTLWETIENVGFHLVRNGMIETYSIWNLHGEQLDNASSSNVTRVDNIEPIVDPNEQVIDIINDAFPFASTNINQEGEDDMPTPMDSAEFEQYEQLLKSANQELYPGCESFFVLTAIVELMHGKIKYRMSNLCFDYFLGVFKRMLPTDNCLPKDHRQAQKVLNGLGLGYEKIHACKNNCMLFYKEYETLDTCPICKEK